MKVRRATVVKLGLLLLVALVALAALWGSFTGANRRNVVAYFDNSNGIYAGDKVIILGVPVGKIDKIEPQRDRVKVSFYIDSKYQVPADAKAVILSPTLVTARSIQLTPAYSGGPELVDGAVIPQDRTAVPVEYDDLRKQLQKLAETLQPTKPGGVSTLGEFINTAANNLRGQGPDIRNTIIQLSQAVSALGDHSNDLFTTFKNLSTLVSALHDSSGLLSELNQNLAAVTKLVSNNPNEVGHALTQLSSVADDVKSFVAENRDTLGTTADKLASVSQAVADSREDLKQTLHVAAPAGQNFLNIYQPAQAALSGILAANNFSNPIQFLCGAIQAASRLGAEQSAKLCVQYLAPIIKNRQYPFLPLGLNPFVGPSARPNELTYSEDWLRPDYVPPAPPANGAPPADGPALAAEAVGIAPAQQSAVATNPDAGLQGLMAPPGGGQ